MMATECVTKFKSPKASVLCGTRVYIVTHNSIFSTSSDFIYKVCGCDVIIVLKPDTCI